MGESGITGMKPESLVSVLGESEMAGMTVKVTESVISETENESLVSAITNHHFPPVTFLQSCAHAPKKRGTLST